MTNKIKFIVECVEWWDRSCGTTYQSCRITRASDGAVCHVAMECGHGEAYRSRSLEVMAKEGWLPEQYRKRENRWCYERENDYPIKWMIVSKGLKRECLANGEE